MKHQALILCAAALLVSSALSQNAPSGNGRKTYKWVDEQGVNHYGDHIPPEYASQEQHIFNSRGIEVEHMDAVKSPDQQALEEQKRLEAEQRENRDRNLLTTYGSVQEIEHLRDQRLTLLADQMKVTGQFLEILDGKMKKLRIASMRFKPYSTDPNAPPMTDQTAEDLVRVGTDMRTQEENLREKRAEQATMSKQFESDIARFKELKGLH